MPQIEKIMSDSCSTQETTLKNAFSKKSKMAPHYPMITSIFTQIRLFFNLRVYHFGKKYAKFFARAFALQAKPLMEN